MKLNQVIDELVEERGLDRQTLATIVCNGMLSAYEKKYPELVFKVDYDSNEDLMTILTEKDVVAQVEDEEMQVSVRKAHAYDKKAQVGDKVFVPFLGKIGRIEILRAKQVIANSIREIEAESVYNEFKGRESEIVHGVIHKCERGGAVVKLGETMAFLPKSLMIPGDKCIVGYPVRALLKEVLLEPRGDNQLILDRTSELFLQHLVELEIPEVFERIVEIKKIVRIPGYKSKIAVTSHDQNIDPVGTCIGVGGARIKPILKEIGGEKIDVVTWSESPESFIKDALKPAQVRRVEIIGRDTAQVWIAEDQRSVAIGKMGQNIALASRLTGYNINLMESDDRPKNQNVRASSDEELLKNQMVELGKKEEVHVDETEPGYDE